MNKIIENIHSLGEYSNFLETEIFDISFHQKKEKKEKLTYTDTFENQ